jgi:hypothetical protein
VAVHRCGHANDQHGGVTDTRTEVGEHEPLRVVQGPPEARPVRIEEVHVANPNGSETLFADIKRENPKTPGVEG